MELKFPARQFAIGPLFLLFLSGCMSQTITPTVILETTSTPTVTEPVPPAITFLPTPTITQTPGPASAEALAYLNEFLDIFLQNTVNRNELDPEQVRAEAFDQVAGAQTTDDTYQTIRYILSHYGNHHSFLWSAEEYNQIMESEHPEPGGIIVDGKFGYINPGTCCISAEQQLSYANKVLRLVTEIAAQSPCGWIIDLSRETGGDMWFGLAGLGPLIGEGEVGAFLYPDGSMQYWFNRNGEVGYGNTTILQVDYADLSKNLSDAPVAVLINYSTASAGEAIAIAFIGRDNTRFFGDPTAGFSTANHRFDLSDGAQLVLTVAYDVDRTGQVYDGKIIPDEQAYTGIIDNKVKNWLLSQPACGNP